MKTLVKMKQKDENSSENEAEESRNGRLKLIKELIWKVLCIVFVINEKLFPSQRMTLE